MAREKRNLSDRLIRALALEACADEIEQGVGGSEHIMVLVEGAGGNDLDIGAGQRAQERLAAQLRARAEAIYAALEREGLYRRPRT